MTYTEFKNSYPNIYLDSDYFTNIDIQVFKEHKTIEGDLDLASMKGAMVCLEGLTVNGNIVNSFAAFGKPLIVLGQTKANALLLSGSIIYIDLESVLAKVLAIYAYKGYIQIAKGSVTLFLDDTEYANTLLNHIKVKTYISDEVIYPHENVTHNMGFSYFANFFQNEEWVEIDKDYDDNMEIFEAEYADYNDFDTYKPSKYITSAWKMVEHKLDFDNLIEKLDKN